MIVIDWVRNVTSKVLSHYVCEELEFDLQTSTSKEEKNEKTSGSTKLEVWTNRSKMIRTTNRVM